MPSSSPGPQQLMKRSRCQAGEPARGHHTVPGVGGGEGGDAGAIHLRTWTAQKIMALCSLGLPSKCGYLSEERLFHSVLLLFPLHPSALSMWPGFLISELCGISHLNDQVLKGEGGTTFMVPPCRLQIFICHCLAGGDVYPVLKVNINSPQRGLGRSPGGGHGNPLQYSCLENPQGQRSLVGCSPWGSKESDVSE